jgi:surface protein
MQYTFSDCASLTDLSGIADWDTSKVTNLYYAFYNCSKLKDASCLSNWDTTKLTNQKSTFANTGITDASLYPTWYSAYRAPATTTTVLDTNASDASVLGQSSLAVTTQ